MPVWSFPAVINGFDGIRPQVTLDLGCRLYIDTEIRVSGLTAHKPAADRLAELLPVGTKVLATCEGVTGASTAAHLTLADGRDVASTARARKTPLPVQAAYGGTLDHVWTYPATITALTDGDTFTACVATGTPVVHRLPVRVAHCNAPEKDTAEGQAAIVWAERVLTPGLPVTLVARRLEKYGRLLATVFLPDGHDYRETIIAAGHAVPYEGGAR